MCNMKNKKYTFGDITFEIESPILHEDKNTCEAFLSDRETDCLIRVCLCEEDAAPDCKTERHGNVITRHLTEKQASGMSVSSLLASSEAAFVFPEYDAFILHAAYIIYEGQAILFTAPSGTGKSTQAEFWKTERGAEIVNGDRVLITKRNGRFYANGIYASGTSGISRNATAPIRAVVLLEQGADNEQLPVPPRMLFLRTLCECSYDVKNKEQCEKITELVSDMINALPVVCYSCRNNPDAVDSLERTMLWKKE